MENTRKEVVETFIKYITGVYVLQQDFIEDMRGGLQAVLEKYEIGVAGSTIVAAAVQEQPTEVQAAPKKTRKKSTKKEVEVPKEVVQDIEEPEVQNLKDMQEVQEAEAVQETQEVQEAEAVQDIEEPDVQDLQVLQEEDNIQAVEEEQNDDVDNVPSHVKESINENIEKKKRKPKTTKKEKELMAQARIENGEAVVEEKKSKTNAYKVFMAEFTRATIGQKMKMAERGPKMSEEWKIIKNDKDRFKVYQQKADEINKENGF